MKVFSYKALAIAVATVGLATACERNSVERDAYVPPESPPVERSTTAQGTTSPSAITSMDQGYAHEADLTPTGSVAEADYEETLQFQGSELTAASVGKLGELVDSLDADKPVKVVVAMDDDIYENSRDQQTGTSVEQAGVNQQDRERYTSAFGQRVDVVKQYLEEQGVEVTQWQFERIDEQDLAQQRNAEESAEDVQSVRLVISADPQGSGFSAVSDE